MIPKKTNMMKVNIPMNTNKKVNSNNPLKRKINDFDGDTNKKVNSNNPLKRKINDFDGKKNKRVNSKNMRNENINVKSRCEEIEKQKIKLFKGYHISADNEIAKTKGSEYDFVSIIGGICDTHPIGNDYQIVYNKQSIYDNQFLLSNVHYTTIKGTIIIYNTKGKKVSLEEIRKILKEDKNQILIY